MRIAAARVRMLEVPDDDRRAGVPERQARTRPMVTLRLRTDQGVEGIGVAFVFGGLTRALAAALEELAEQTIGEDPVRIEAITGRLRAHAVNVAASGIFLIALSAIDCALWDLRGQFAGQPLWKLLGGSRRQVPAYASGRLHRDVPDRDLAGAAERAATDGFRTMKMHLGLGAGSSPEAELRRARIVRDAAGPQMRLGCDINERWSVGEAVAIGRRLEDIGFFWIEDPVSGDDHAGLARVAAALATPVMAGERAWGVTPFRSMLEARSVDYAMIDVMHAGGISAWMKIAAMAEAFNVPVVSHLMPELQAQLVAAVPNGLMAEHKEWTWRLFDGMPDLIDGDYVLSDRPGHGLRFSAEFEPLT